MTATNNHSIEAVNHDSSIATRQGLLQGLQTVRDKSVSICQPLVTEDHVIQTMPDVSPPKWHLAHTSWFFETFILRHYARQYEVFHPAYDHLFNSYYVTHGQPFLRPRRGLLSRPTVDDIRRYRAHIDQHMLKLVADCNESDFHAIKSLTLLGLHHEQQHQELLYTDIKHILAQNPLAPVYHEYESIPESRPTKLHWTHYQGGLQQVGHNSETFAYDNEGPAHQLFLNDYKLASRLVTNGEYLEFMQDSGYQTPAHWMSEGWSWIQQESIVAPLYWQQRDGEWYHFTLEGMQPVNMNEPVYHVSQYEADAYARWAGKRLPNEHEWELAAIKQPIEGNLGHRNHLRPIACGVDTGLQQMYGDVWEWTQSAYGPYSGYKPDSGTIGEYNGKFMSSQMVLRGGSFVTPIDHIRPTYRNFFYPKDRWQFSGIRLADDA